MRGIRGASRYVEETPLAFFMVGKSLCSANNVSRHVRFLQSKPGQTYETVFVVVIYVYQKPVGNRRCGCAELAFKEAFGPGLRRVRISASRKST